ncbi:MAG: phosphoribosylaminoimidazolesuccinocarboxamide synthase [Bacteroidetes bacterium 4572_128]|nr:MAG: phosphoribosylaminoimidazolesuccinocarboxamide synthase [Bacteroidetes bacterium 4572_128]
MKKSLIGRNFKFENLNTSYKGKVRDLYKVANEYLIMVVSDRISAFDKVLPIKINYKGEVLNQIASKFLDATSDIVPNWKIAVPDPMVTIGHLVVPFKIEMVVRGYLTGHAWRIYKNGDREICGLILPDGMKENQKFESPIITPTTKDEHDEDISKEEILKRGLATKQEYEALEKYSLELFQRGTEIAKKRGLILVDTKYEFGKKNGKIYLIDEIHTPDSSRFFYESTYKENFEKNKKQRQLSKEFLRIWLMENNFQGKEGEKIPEITEEFANKISERYIELYENITGELFKKTDISNLEKRIENNINNWFLDFYKKH